jgi:PAS domain S-box-containing protein
MGAEWIDGNRGNGGAPFSIERDLLCMADAEGRFTGLNAAWERVLGWSRDELMASPFIDFVHPEDVERTVTEASRVAEVDSEIVDFENRYRTKSGDWRWLRWSARSDGQMWFAVAWDVTERKEAEERLRRALTEDRLVAYSQPIVDRSGRVEHEELLVRLRMAEGSDAVLSPSEFLPDAERCGLVGGVDRWMVNRAIGLAGNGRSPEVNLSAHSIADEELTSEFAEALEAAPESASKIVLEITETAVLEHFDAAVEFAERLGPLGCRFALDDFGTGYGCFTYLRQLPVDFIKIDTSFVRDLPRSPEDQAIVRSIVAIANELGKQTVAEGVEDEHTLQMLYEYGVDQAQGYLLGRPQPVIEPAAAA